MQIRHIPQFDSWHISYDVRYPEGPFSILLYDQNRLVQSYHLVSEDGLRSMLKELRPTTPEAQIQNEIRDAKSATVV